MNTIVIYHRADFDGLFSGAVCKLFMPDAKLIGWDYGDPIPQIPEGTDKVYIVDLSIPGLMLTKEEEWVTTGAEIVWIDHHASAIAKYSPEYPGLRCDGVAACRLAWQWFVCMEGAEAPPTKEQFLNRAVEEPFALTLAGEYDIWNLTDPLAVAFQFGLVAEGYRHPGDFVALLDTYMGATHLNVNHKSRVEQICGSGNAVLAWQHNFAAQTVKERGYIRDWEGVKFMVLASVHARNSMWFPDNALPDEVEALMCWRYAGDGKMQFSMYHRAGHEELDLSQIAVKYGGGGHKGACGFEMEFGEALAVIY